MLLTSILVLNNRGLTDRLPPTWFQWGSGYTLKMDTDIRHSGNASMLIQYLQEKPPSSNSFGCIAHVDSCELRSGGGRIKGVYEIKT